MFDIGDKVVYPMYGAGIIQSMEEKCLDGKQEMYYVIGMPIGNMKITVEVNKAEKLGLREVADSKHVYKALQSSMGVPNVISENWNQRYKENLEKIKTGKIDKLAEVVRNLWNREKERGLSSAEKKMLSNAKQILISEVVLFENINKEEAENRLLDALS
jgi:CarD family transcriptional regulator